MRSELRFVLRGLYRAPLFSLVSILTLGVAIGGTTAMSSFVRGILLSSLPYRDASELVTLSSYNRAQGFEGLYVWGPLAVRLREQARSFSLVSGVRYEEINLSGGDSPARVTAAMVLPDLLSLLGIEPVSGRSFAPGERDEAAILSHRLWMSRFGGSPEAIGSAIHHDGRVSTIVGVLPAGVEIPLREADLLLPMRSSELSGPEDVSLQLFARLASDATLEGARAEVEAIARAFEEETAPPVRGWLLGVSDLHSEIVGEVAETLWILQAAVGLALLIAIANFASLLIARGTLREREIAVLRAVGAGRSAIARLLVTESVFIALAGGLSGLLVARFATDFFLSLAPENLPRTSEVTMSAEVLLFGLSLALGCGLLAGILPAVFLSRVSPERALRRASASATTSRSSGLLRSFLTACQIAAALTLTIGCGLLIQSLARLLSVNPGFEPAHLLTLQVSFPTDRYPEASQQSVVLEELLERLEALPDVQSVAAAPWTPMTGAWSRAQMSVESRDGAVGERSRWPMVLGVSPGFFRTLSIPLRGGRDFDSKERAEVAVVNRRLAEQAWPGSSAVGKRIKLGGPGSEYPWLEVVGVVEDARLIGLATPEEEAMFRPLLPLTSPYSRICLLVRVGTDPLLLVPSLRAAVREVDGEIPLAEIRSMDELIGENAATSRFRLAVVLSFASLAIALAGLGIYGTIGYWVASRRREIGLRMALGANRDSVLRLVVGHGAILVVSGLLVGVVLSVVVARFLEALLFEVSPTDPIAFVGAVLLLGGVGVASAFFPARKAAGLDPMTVLRSE